MKKYFFIFLLIVFSFTILGCTKINTSDSANKSLGNDSYIITYYPEVISNDSGVIQEFLPENPNNIILNNNSNITCLMDIKSGLCGLKENIFPLENERDSFKNIYVYSPGILLETDNFIITFDAPQFLLTGEQTRLSIIIKNKKNYVNSFKYNYFYCDSNEKVCSDIYNIIQLNNLEGSKLLIQDKNEFYEISFQPYESKSFELIINPKSPTLVKSHIYYFILDYFDENFLNPYNLLFQAWIKPGKNYETVNCGGFTQPIIIFPPRYTSSIQEYSYGYLRSSCCNEIFYPNFECCSDADCNSGSLNGKCFEGLCIPKNNKNKLIGNKKILVGYNFNDNNNCEEINLNDLNSDIKNDFSIMNNFYDHMAELLLNESSNFVNFEIVKAVKLPAELKQSFESTFKSEDELINYLSTKCNINMNDFDFVTLNSQISSRVEVAGMALSKLIFYTANNAPTLIHETGHIFGCIDLYDNLGGHLQWSNSIYGQLRHNIYNYINNNSINEIPEQALNVCRGFLGWTDLNNNGIIDINE